MSYKFGVLNRVFLHHLSHLVFLLERYKGIYSSLTRKQSYKTNLKFGKVLG
jgi:hypothetical protein